MFVGWKTEGRVNEPSVLWGFSSGKYQFTAQAESESYAHHVAYFHRAQMVTVDCLFLCYFSFYFLFYFIVFFISMVLNRQI
jgi:hypothetical protein